MYRRDEPLDLGCDDCGATCRRSGASHAQDLRRKIDHLPGGRAVIHAVHGSRRFQAD